MALLGVYLRSEPIAGRPPLIPTESLVLLTGEGPSPPHGCDMESQSVEIAGDKRR
jgi:hypothetical protein